MNKHKLSRLNIREIASEFAKKLPLRRLFTLVCFLSLLLLTFNWMYIHIVEPVAYPYERREDLLLVSSKAVKFVDAPINTKERIKVETLNAKENIFRVQYEFEVTLAGNASATMHFEQGIRADQVIEIQVLFNRKPLTLRREERECVKGEPVLYLDDWTLRYPESEVTEFYLIPDINLAGSGLVNRLEISVTLYRMLKPSHYVNVPWFFSPQRYALFIDIPIISALVPAESKSRAIFVEAQCKYTFKTIERNTSGWMGTYTLRTFIEDPREWALTFPVPIEQNVTLREGIFSSETCFSSGNRADRLLITFVPHLSVVVSIFALYIPLAVAYWGRKQEWSLPRKLLASYGTFFAAFLTINILNLESVALLLGEITELTSIFFTFAYLFFPALYILLESRIPTSIVGIR